MRLFLPALAICLMAAGARAYEAPQPVQDEAITGNDLPKKLSEFRFFTDARGTVPNGRVVPYELNSALFSDYAEKFRYIYVPANRRLSSDVRSPETEGLLRFPVGSAIIKSFGYEQDGPEGKAMRLLETRVLLRRADGWLALPYVWNEEQTEALLKVAGTRIPVTFADPSGKIRTISYSVPNKNQCKECHSLDNVVMPIGPENPNLTGASKMALRQLGLIQHKSRWGSMVDYDDQDAPLNLRARAYLDINCAHCHNARGSASNSGLFLDYNEKHPVRIGINKRPVAAGRGSGTHDFDIAPGDPDASIMIYRLKSLDPGISMPEVGRSIVHDEGVALLSQWIAEMEKRN